MGKQIKAVFSDPLRAITAISTFGLSEEIGASARALNVPSPTVRKIRSVGDKVYVYTGSAIALANAPAALGEGASGFGAAPAAGGPLPEASIVTGVTEQGETVIVSEPLTVTQQGTSLQHTVLDTSLYAPGDVAGPIVDFGPGTELTATIPEGQGILATTSEQSGLELTNPSTGGQSWWSQTAAGAAGTVGGGLVNRFLQKYVTAPLADLFGIGVKTPTFGGTTGGGGGVGGPPSYLNWLTVFELLALAGFLILFVKLVIRR